MAGTGTISIGGVITGLATGQKQIDLATTLAAAVDQSNTTNLSTGDNTFTPPTGATVVMIIPPAGNAQTLKLKGAAGDTGVVLSKTEPSFISRGDTAAIIINSTGSVAGITVAYL